MFCCSKIILRTAVKLKRGNGRRRAADGIPAISVDDVITS